MILEMIFMEILAPAGTMIIQEAAVGTIQIILTHALCAVLVQIYNSVKRQHQCVQIAILIVVINQNQNQKHLGGLD